MTNRMILGVGGVLLLLLGLLAFRAPPYFVGLGAAPYPFGIVLCLIGAVLLWLAMRKSDA